MYYTGDSGEQNDELAFEYYQKAAEYNSNKAKMLLGRMYYLGRGTKKDLTTAYRYIWDAATGEGEFMQRICVNPSTWYLTGQMVESGEAVFKIQKWLFVLIKLRRNYKEFEKVDIDDEDILPKDFLICKGEIENTIGKIYERGTHDVKCDFETSAKYFEKASEHGNLDATKMLAKKYYDGRGVAKDDFKAFDLFLEVAAEIEDVEFLKTAIEILKKQSPDNWSLNSYFNEIEKVAFIKSEITNPEFF